MRCVIEATRDCRKDYDSPLAPSTPRPHPPSHDLFPSENDSKRAFTLPMDLAGKSLACSGTGAHYRQPPPGLSSSRWSLDLGLPASLVKASGLRRVASRHPP